MKKWETGRQTISQRVVRRRISSLLSIALLIALSVVASSRVRAQVECLGKCEAQFALCVSNSEPGGCLETYEACVDACLGSSAAILN
jgi:hypothetical protein